MPSTRRGAVMDLDSVAEEMVEKLMSNNGCMEALSKIIRESIKEELRVVSQELEQKVNLLQSTVDSRIMGLENTIDSYEQYTRINNVRFFFLKTKARTCE